MIKLFKLFKHKHIWRRTGDCSLGHGTLYYKVKCKKCKKSKHITLGGYLNAVDEWSKGGRTWKVVGRATLVLDPKPNPRNVEDYIE